MQYPPQNTLFATSQNTVSLDANVQSVVNAINTNTVIPYGDYGGSNVYYFQTINNGLGNLIYTIFDRDSTLGLASFTVRYGAATTVRDAILLPFPRSQIDLQHVILPHIPLSSTVMNGSVTP